MQKKSKSKSNAANKKVTSAQKSKAIPKATTANVNAVSSASSASSSSAAPKPSTSKAEDSNSIDLLKEVRENLKAQAKQRQERIPETAESEEEPSEVDSFLLDTEAETELENSEEDSEDLDNTEEDSEDDNSEEEENSEKGSDCLEERFLLEEELSRRLGGKGTDSSVDPETQARLEALLEAAGIGKLTGDSKQLTDPEVLKHLTSSVSCALDEAAAALTRMRTDHPKDGRTLVEACNEGDISKVRQLLDEGRVSVHDTTEEGESLLSLACSAGYFELAQVLLAMRANVEDRGIKGDCTPLMEAASAGHVDIVKLLLAHGADVNSQSSSGYTSLMFACSGGHEEVVKVLLDAGAKVEDHNENGHTPLMEAASAGHVGVAKILLKYGAGINTHSNEFKESALTLACYKGHLEMVRFLLEAGADQEHKTDEMHTALMEASMDGHVEVARLLLDSGAQVNMPADSFESPLTLAACGGHVELAMLLLERGANIEEVNDEGYTPLMEAAREGHEEVVALLLSQGADINAQTEETQETALTLACCGGFLEVADFLIKAGADIELGASTPLMEAAQEGHLELVRYLLENNASVNAQTGTGDTALTYACENGHTDVGELLLKYNAELEHESEGGRTPLMKAARAGHLSTVQFLISQGADVNKATQNNDHTPLSLACAGGHQAVVELLLQHGADPFHKLKDNSTMLIEAAKGGHTNVVQILIDYPNTFYGFAATNSLDNPNLDKIQGVSESSSNEGIASKGGNSLKSVLRKNRQGQQNAKNELSASKSTKLSTSPALNSVDAPGYDFLESSGFVIEGLADKGLDAKSYIQSMLNRAEGSTREEQIQQKEQILAELQRVEKELQEKAQIQLILKDQQLSEQRESGEGAESPSSGEQKKQSGETDVLANKVANLSLDQAKPGTTVSTTVTTNTSCAVQTSPPSMLSQRALANMPPSERPKAKPSRKIDGKGGKKSQLQAALQQHSQQLAQLQQLQQLNQQLQQQVLQQRQLKQQNQATLAALQQNAIANQQQLAALQQNVAQLQQLEQHILAQQQQSNNGNNSSSQQNSNNQQSQQHQQLQQRVQQILQQKQQLQQQIKQFQQQVEQQLAYTQHTTAAATQQSSSGASTPSKASTKRSKEGDEKVKKKANGNSNACAQGDDKSTSTSEIVKTTQASQNMSQIDSFAPGNPDIEPLTQDPTLLSSMDPMQLAAAMQNCTMLDVSSQALISGYKDGLQAAAAGALHSSQASGGALPLQYAFPPATSGIVGSSSGTSSGSLDSMTAFGHQLLLQPSQFPFSQANNNSNEMSNTPINFSAADLVHSPYITTTLGANNNNSVNSDLFQEQPDLPPIVDSSSSFSATSSASNGTAKPKKAKTVSSNKVIKESLGQESLLDQNVVPPPTSGASVVDLDSETESNHDTALTLACAGGHEELVRLLLSKGSDIEHRDKKGFTPLILAATAGHEKVVEILLDHNADIEAQSERTKDTPLSLACSGGRYEVVEILLARNANKEHRNVSDYTPLSLAASGGYVNIIKLLLAHGAEINSRTGSKLGISPLMLAAMNGHTAAVKLLLDMGSDINAQIETNRNTALTLACFQGRHEVVSLLLDRKANVEHRAKTGLTPLMEAASGGYVEVGRVLLDKGADVNAPPVPSSRDTALTIAADKGHYRFVELLLSRGAQVDVRNKKGNSSLWLAANGGHLDVVQLLYSAGADIDSQDNRKVSCLMAAFRKGHSKVVKWMVKHVTQFPSDTELTRYIATINVNDKDLLKKCQQCMEIIRIAKERQAAEAAKNASSLLEELDRESKLEQSKKEAAARKREKKKRKKMEKLGKTTNNKEDMSKKGEDENEPSDNSDISDDEKEKSPEVENIAPVTNRQEKQEFVEPTPVSSSKKKKSKSRNRKSLEEDTIKEKIESDKKSSEPRQVEVPKESSQSLVHSSIVNGPSSQKSEQSSSKKNVTNSNRRGNASPTPVGKKLPTSSTSATTTVSTSTNSNSVKPNQVSTAPASSEATGWKEVVRKSKKVSVPANAISRVIGRGGSNINAIRELSSAHIEIEKQSKGGADRTIIIKGSAEATRLANTWIQGIITFPEKDISEIIGKAYKNLHQAGGSLATVVGKSATSQQQLQIKSTIVTASKITTASTSIGVQQTVTTTRSSVVNASKIENKKMPVVASGKSLGNTSPVNCGTSSKPPGVATKASSFAAVAGGISTDVTSSNINSTQETLTMTSSSQQTLSSFGGVAVSSSSNNIPTTQSNKSTSRPNDIFASTVSKETKDFAPFKSSSINQEVVGSTSYSPFKYNVNWGGNSATLLEGGAKNSKDIFSSMNSSSQFVPTDQVSHADISKAPGYRSTNARTSPASVSTLTNIGTWGTMPVATAGQPVKQGIQLASRPAVGNVEESSQLFDQSQERCNSAPGTPMSPTIPAPIGPPQQQYGSFKSSFSPGSDGGVAASLSSSTQLRSQQQAVASGRLSSLSSNIIGFGRSMTPDADVDLHRPSSSALHGAGISSTTSVTNSTSTNRPSSVAGIDKRSGEQISYFNDAFSGSSIINESNLNDASTLPENLLFNTARQIAAVGAGLSDFNQLDYSSTNSFGNCLIGQRFMTPSTSSGGNSLYMQQQQSNAASKLNPNAPDFSRFPQDFMRGGQAVQPPSRTPLSKMNNQQYQHPYTGNSTRTNNTFGQGTMGSSGGFSGSLNRNLMNSNPSGVHPYFGQPPPDFDVDASTILSGRSVREITDMLGGTDLPNFMPPPSSMSGPPPSRSSFLNSPPMENLPQQHHSQTMEPKFSRPIGAERGSRVQQNSTSNAGGTKISNSPWDNSSLYTSGGEGLTNGGLGSGSGNTGFHPGLQGQTLGNFMKESGFNNTGAAGGTGGLDSPFLSPLKTLSPNVTPSKDLFGGEFMGSGSAPGSGLKKGGFQMDRPDTSGVRKNMAHMWGKKWND